MSSFMLLFIIKGTIPNVAKFKEIDWIIKFSNNKMYILWLSYVLNAILFTERNIYYRSCNASSTVLCRKQLSKKQTFSTRDKRVSSWVVSSIFNPHYKSTSDGVSHSMKHRMKDAENNNRIFKARFCEIQGWKNKFQILHKFGGFFATIVLYYNCYIFVS